MKHFDHIRSGSIIWSGIFVGLILLLLFLFLQGAHYRSEAAAQAVGQEIAANTAMEQMKTEQLSRLANSGWLDQEAGTVGIPIEDAMARIVQTQGGVAQ